MLYGTINIVTHPVIFYVYFHWHIIYGTIFWKQIIRFYILMRTVITRTVGHVELDILV